jgi:hypothetical protein
LTTNKKSKANAKATKETSVKKSDTIAKSSLSFDNEILLAPSKEKLYTMLEVAPKIDQ